MKYLILELFRSKEMQSYVVFGHVKCTGKENSVNFVSK